MKSNPARNLEGEIQEWGMVFHILKEAGVSTKALLKATKRRIKSILSEKRDNDKFDIWRLRCIPKEIGLLWHGYAFDDPAIRTVVTRDGYEERMMKVYSESLVFSQREKLPERSNLNKDDVDFGDTSGSPFYCKNDTNAEAELEKHRTAFNARQKEAKEKRESKKEEAEKHLDQFNCSLSWGTLQFFLGIHYVWTTREKCCLDQSPFHFWGMSSPMVNNRYVKLDILLKDNTVQTKMFDQYVGKGDKELEGQTVIAFPYRIVTPKIENLEQLKSYCSETRLQPMLQMNESIVSWASNEQFAASVTIEEIDKLCHLICVSSNVNLLKSTNALNVWFRIFGALML